MVDIRKKASPPSPPSRLRGVNQGSFKISAARQRTPRLSQPPQAAHRDTTLVNRANSIHGICPGRGR